MRKTIQVLRGLSDALLVLVLIAMLALFIAPKLLGAQLLVVMSQSMEPSIPMGSVVVSRPVPVSEIGVGDAITFTMRGGPGGPVIVTHRVIEVIGASFLTQFRTQGDAVGEPDQDLVAAGDVIGKVAFHVPIAGYVMAFIRTPLGFSLLIILPAGLLIAGEVGDILVAGRRRRKDSLPTVPEGKNR